MCAGYAASYAPIDAAKWKRRFCLLQRGVLYYDPKMKLSKLRKQVALEHCDVSIDAYASPNDGGLHGPVIVLSVNGSKGKVSGWKPICLCQHI